MRRYGSKRPSRKSLAVSLENTLLHRIGSHGHGWVELEPDVPDLARGAGMSEDAVRAMIRGLLHNRRFA